MHVHILTAQNQLRCSVSQEENVIILCVFFIYFPWTFGVSWCSGIFFLFLFPFQRHTFLLFMNSVQIHQGLFFCFCVCVLFPHFGPVLPFSSSLLLLYFWIFIKLSEFLLRMGPWLRSEPWLIGFRRLWRKSVLAASDFLLCAPCTQLPLRLGKLFLIKTSLHKDMLWFPGNVYISCFGVLLLLGQSAATGTFSFLLNRCK